MTTPVHARPRTAAALLAQLPALLASLLLGIGSWVPAHAQTRSVNGELALSSELTERGAFVGQRRPLVQAAASLYDATGWSLGGALAVPSNGLNHSRLVLRGAYDRPLADDWQAQMALQYYGYPGSLAGRGFDRFEAGLSLSWRDRLVLAFTGFHYLHPSPQTPALHWALDVGSRWPLAAKWSGLAAVGLAQVQRRSAYGYGSLGLAWHDGDWAAELNLLAAASQARRLVPGSTTGHLSFVLTRKF